MSDKYYQTGRAHAAEGKYDPPGWSWMLDNEDTAKAEANRERYKEGHADKLREMEEDKKRR